MNAELSRRVAKIMHTPTVMNLITKDRQAFIKAVDRANSFAELPKQYKQLIQKAESENP